MAISMGGGSGGRASLQQAVCHLEFVKGSWKEDGAWKINPRPQLWVYSPTTTLQYLSYRTLHTSKSNHTPMAIWQRVSGMGVANLSNVQSTTFQTTQREKHPPYESETIYTNANYYERVLHLAHVHAKLSSEQHCDLYLFKNREGKSWAEIFQK